MAIVVPIVSEFLDKGIVAAQAGFTNFKNRVAEADGAMGKFKAGAGAALDTVKANATAFAAAAGTAIFAFAAKGVAAFQDLALAAGKFSDATGLAVEDASRWLEVTGDLGVESTVIEKAINKMNLAIAANGKEWRALGVDTAYTSGGLVDVNETFLRTIDALNQIEDPTRRASYANKILGKSWMDLSEIIKAGSGSLRESLKAVSDQKVIDPKELENARKFRENMDTLKDSMEDVQLSIGGALIPALNSLLQAMEPVIAAAKVLSLSFIDASAGAEKVPSSLKAGSTQMLFFQGLLTKITSFLGIYTASSNDAKTSTEMLTQSWISGYRAMINAQTALEGLDTSLTDVKDAYDELLGRIDERQSWQRLIDDVKSAGDQAVEAFAKKMPNALGISMASLDDAKRSLADYIAKTNEIPPEKKTLYLSALDQASWAQVKAMLDELAIARAVPYQPVLSPGYPGGPTEGGSGGRPIGSAPIGGGKGVKPFNLMTGAGSEATVIVNVAGTVQTENDLIESIRKGLVNAQRSGKGLAYSNTNTF